MDSMEIVRKSKEDASLPKSTTCKIIKEMLPPDVRVARDTQDIFVECCVEFVNLVSSESNEVCNREHKKTITPEHVLKALEVLGFGEYIEEVCAAYEQHRLDTLDSPKGGKFNGIEMTEEEAVAEQQRMFAEARARMLAKPSEPELEETKPDINNLNVKREYIEISEETEVIPAKEKKKIKLVESRNNKLLESTSNEEVQLARRIYIPISRDDNVKLPPVESYYLQRKQKP